MARFKERRQAFQLRKQGKSYSQIKKELGLSKSTLSLWLRNYPLSKEQIDALRGKSPQRIEKYRQTMQRKREKRLSIFYKEEKKKWLPLSSKELFIAGLFLYWGEGNKVQRSTVSINNTDPSVIKFALYWMIKGLSVPRENITVFLHLYNDMDIEKEINYWSEELKMDKNRFTKPYIKKSRRTDLDQKGYGHGTCGIRVNKTEYKERILMAIKAIGEHYGEKVKEF